MYAMFGDNRLEFRRNIKFWIFILGLLRIDWKFRLWEGIQKFERKSFGSYEIDVAQFLTEYEFYCTFMFTYFSDYQMEIAAYRKDIIFWSNVIWFLWNPCSSNFDRKCTFTFTIMYTKFGDTRIEIAVYICDIEFWRKVIRLLWNRHRFNFD